MSNSKHTSGPWAQMIVTSDERRPDHIKVYGEPVECEQFGKIATPVCSTYFNSDLDRANAHLIAAAPEMLEALESLLVDLKSGDTVRLNHSFLAVLVENVIIKAKGGA